MLPYGYKESSQSREALDLEFRGVISHHDTGIGKNYMAMSMNGMGSRLKNVGVGGIHIWRSRTGTK